MKKFRVNIRLTTEQDYWHVDINENVVADDHKEAIVKVLESNYFEVLKGKKPVCNTYVDDKDGNQKIAGYIYRVKTHINAKQVYFNAWTDVDELVAVDYDVLEK